MFIASVLMQYGPALLAADGVYSQELAERTAALAALQSAVNDSGGELIDALMPEMQSKLDRTEHDALTPSQVITCSTSAFLC